MRFLRDTWELCQVGLMTVIVASVVFAACYACVLVWQQVGALLGGCN